MNVDEVEDDFRLVRSLIERLPHEPHSMWAAKRRGGLEHFGWGVGEYQQANIIDSINTNTAVNQAKGSKKKPKLPAPSYRPGDKTTKKSTVRPKSIKDMKDLKLGG